MLGRLLCIVPKAIFIVITAFIYLEIIVLKHGQLSDLAICLEGETPILTLLVLEGGGL